jgi:hypothetical protein
VVGARRAERGEPRVLGPRQEVQYGLRVAEVADLRAVRRGEPAQQRCQGGGTRLAFGGRERAVCLEHRAEGLAPAPLGEEPLGLLDDQQRVRLAGVRRVTPGRDPVSAEHAADRPRVRLLHGGDVQAELEAGTAPGYPHHPVAEARAGQLLAVGRAGERDAGVRVQVVDVRGVHQAVHGGVDGRRRAAPAVQAVVERGDHLVLALHPGVDVGERPQPVEAQHGESRLGQRAEVAAGALDPQEFDGAARRGVRRGALGRRVAARVVGVARIGAQPVGACEELGRDFGGVGHVFHSWGGDEMRDDVMNRFRWTVGRAVRACQAKCSGS